MAIFTESVCLDWLNEEALYEQLFSKEDFQNAIKKYQIYSKSIYRNCKAY